MLQPLDSGSPDRQSTRRRGAARCGHAASHEFVSFRARPQADVEREAMAAAPEWAGHRVSPLYRSRSGGWAWTLCPECAGTPDDAGTPPPAS
jgi:hypothetical protein